MSNAIKKRAKDWLNVQFGSDVENLGKCEELFKEWSEKKADLERTLQSFSSEGPSKVIDAAQNVQEATSTISKSLASINEMLEKIKHVTSSTDEVYWSLKKHFDKINEVESLVAYLQILTTVQDASKNLQLYISSQDTDKAIFQYKLLCNISLSLLNSKCSHLKQFLFETTKHWNSILKTIICSDFCESLKGVSWPMVSKTIATPPSNDALLRFQTAIKHLLNVQLPVALEEQPTVCSSLQVSFPHYSLPVVQLLQPLRKRFIYHFSGSRQTNRIDKPEWYFTQVLSWISDHEHFLQTYVQPVYDHLNIDTDVTVEVKSGLVELSVEKLQADLEEIQYDDALFSHTVDEALGFERELRQVYFYPPSLPGPLHVLTQAQLFVKWIQMERKFAREKMDGMLSSETAWAPLSGLDDDKLTEVGHTFLALLNTMMDRYSLLPQPGHRLQFVELELELIDDFRISLLQILHSEHTDPINSKIPAILNTILHLKSVLEQYDASPTVLLLQHYKSQYNPEGGDGETGLFQESITLLERLEQQLLNELSSEVLMEVKARSRPYRKYRWFSLTEDELDDSFVTQEACPMFQAIADHLHKLYEKLSEKLFNKLWKLFASQLNNFLLEDLILDTTFSVAGGKVLKKDVEKFLLPMFQQYTPSPQAYFLGLVEACSYLCLPELSASLRRALITENYRSVEAGLPIPPKHLNTAQVAAVLSHRLDVSPSLL